MLDQRQQIAQAIGRAQRVDPDHPLDPVGTLVAVVEQGHRQVARLVLLGGQDRVLEVDGHHVRSVRQRLRKAVGPAARHEQEVAA